MVHKGAAYKHERGNTWDNVGQCQLVLMKVTRHNIIAL